MGASNSLRYAVIWATRRLGERRHGQLGDRIVDGWQTFWACYDQNQSNNAPLTGVYDSWKGAKSMSEVYTGC